MTIPSSRCVAKAISSGVALCGLKLLVNFRHCSVLLAAALNTPTYGAGIRLAPDARMDDGLLDFVLIEGISKMSALALLPGLAKDGILRTDRVRRMRAKQIRLSTSRPCLFHGDGEILGSTPVEIEVVPRAIRVLTAAQG